MLASGSLAHGAQRNGTMPACHRLPAQRCAASALNLAPRRRGHQAVQLRRTNVTCALDTRPAADANELAPPSTRSRVLWLARGWGRRDGGEETLQAARDAAEPSLNGATASKSSGSATALNGDSSAEQASLSQPAGTRASRNGSVGASGAAARADASNGTVPQAAPGRWSGLPPPASEASSTNGSVPPQDWDDGYVVSRERVRTPLFRAQQWWESLFVTSEGESRIPEWERPAWMPQWIDPLDRTSDMRRWIAPYLIAPWLFAQLLKFSVVGPMLEQELHKPGGSTVFHLREEQTERVEAEAERFRAHLAFEQLLQRAPTLSDNQILTRVRDKLAEDERELLEHNCASLTELVTDSTYATIVSLNVLVNLKSVRRIQTAVGKEFFSMDSSRQAFLLLLFSDILVGYHSSEGWATALELVADHYGIPERKDLTALFIAVVPVSVDVVFKYWCYSSLRNWSPDTQVILDEIDH